MVPWICEPSLGGSRDCRDWRHRDWTGTGQALDRHWADRYGIGTVERMPSARAHRYSMPGSHLPHHAATS